MRSSEAPWGGGSPSLHVASLRSRQERAWLLRACSTTIGDPAWDDLAVETRQAGVLLLLHGVDADTAGRVTGLEPVEVTGWLHECLDALGEGDPVATRERLEPLFVHAWRAQPRPRTRPVVAGVLAIAVASVLGYAAYDRLTPEPPPPPRTVVVASQLGWSAEQATERLTQDGLAVRVGRTRSCAPAGTVLASTPPAGTALAVGRQVVLTASGGDDEEPCPDAGAQRRAWRFLSFAVGSGPPPAYDDNVYVVVGQGYPVVLSRADAEAGDWGDDSPLTALATAAARPQAQLQVSRLATPPETCGTPRPDGAGDQQVVRLRLGPSTDAQECPTTVDLYPSEDGIFAVVAYRHR